MTFSSVALIIVRRSARRKRNDPLGTCEVSFYDCIESHTWATYSCASLQVRPFLQVTYPKHKASQVPTNKECFEHRDAINGPKMILATEHCTGSLTGEFSGSIFRPAEVMMLSVVWNACSRWEPTTRQHPPFQLVQKVWVKKFSCQN